MSCDRSTPAPPRTRRTRQRYPPSSRPASTSKRPSGALSDKPRPYYGNRGSYRGGYDAPRGNYGYGYGTPRNTYGSGNYGYGSPRSTYGYGSPRGGGYYGGW